MTPTEFIIMFPAFMSTNLNTIQKWLDFNARLLDVASWDTFLQDAIGLTTAHELSIALQAASSPLAAFQGGAGIVTSISAAGVSTSFSGYDTGNSRSDQWYGKTIYGQQYLQIRDRMMSLGVMAC
jgi:hypothetical protein